MAPGGTEAEAAETAAIANSNKQALKFLRAWRINGPWVLTAINSQGHGIKGKTFMPTEKESLFACLDECHRNERNVYFHVNDVGRNVVTKASKDDVKQATHLHVDVDPRAGEDLEAEQARILKLLKNPPEGVPEPTWITYSGGGYQAFWELDKPVEINCEVEKAEDFELYNKQLEVLYKADSCHNSDRIMRLPGTVNWPNEKKLKKGRVPALAKVESFTEKNVYSLDTFAKATHTGSSVTSGAKNKKSSAKLQIVEDDIARFGSIEEIRAIAKGDFPNWLSWTICNGVPLESHPKYMEWKADRSKALFAVCCEMLRLGFADTQIYSVITDSDFSISASVRDKGSSAQIKRYARKQIKSAKEATAEDPTEFTTDKNGNPIAKSPKNIALAIKKLRVFLRKNLLTGDTEVSGLEGHGPAWTDAAEGALILAIDKAHGFLPTESLLRIVVTDIAHNDSHHPIREELDRLQKLYAGGNNLKTWLIDCAGVEDTPLNRAFSRLVLIASVRRVRKPGCKFDFMVVFEGPQGTQKSSLLRMLAICDEWFTDSFSLKASADPKLVIEQTRGRWIVEVAELDGINKAGVEDVKGMLSRTSDRARMAYARHSIEVQRQWVSIGTTNAPVWLKDATGNRRFWPMRLGTIDLVKFAAMRDQLWAEAATAEAEGASIALDPKLYAAAAEAQSARLEEHPFVEAFREYLGDKEGVLPIGEAWKILGILPRDQTRSRNRELGCALRSLGWEKSRRRVTGISSTHVWVRGDSDARICSESQRMCDAF